MDELEIKIGAIAFNEITQAPLAADTDDPVDSLLDFCLNGNTASLPPPLVPMMLKEQAATLPSWMRQKKQVPKEFEEWKKEQDDKDSRAYYDMLVASSGPAYDDERVREVFCRWPWQGGLTFGQIKMYMDKHFTPLQKEIMTAVTDETSVSAWTRAGATGPIVTDREFFLRVVMNAPSPIFYSIDYLGNKKPHVRKHADGKRTALRDSDLMGMVTPDMLETYTTKALDEPYGMAWTADKYVEHSGLRRDMALREFWAAFARFHPLP